MTEENQRDELVAWERLPSEYAADCDCDPCSRGEENPVEGRVNSVTLDVSSIKVCRTCPECGATWHSIYAFEKREEDE